MFALYLQPVAVPYIRNATVEYYTDALGMLRIVEKLRFLLRGWASTSLIGNFLEPQSIILSIAVRVIT